jgi:hypothetical protein
VRTNDDAVADPIDVEVAARVDEVAARGVHDDNEVVAHNRYGRRLVVCVAGGRQADRALAHRVCGVGDVEDADPLAERVGVEERVAVLAHRGDLGHGGGLGVHAGGQVLEDRIGRGALERAGGVIGGIGRVGGRDQGRADEGQAHEGGQVCVRTHGRTVGGSGDAGVNPD